MKKTSIQAGISNTLRFIAPVMLAMVLSIQSGKAQPVHTFTLGDTAFLLDGKPFQIISAELHYPRIPRPAWRDRMRQAKAMGINTIGTYVFWNLHEPQKGQFDFSGNNDIAAFVKTAREEGLWVIIRPSPYVCAEWEFGGYPYWLQNEKGLVVRSKEASYLREYREYILQAAKQLVPLQINHGGNILMVQVENEYGFYSNDKTNIIVSDDWPYILAILNSSISWWLTQQNFPTKQGGFYEFKPMYVSNIPVPPAGKEVKKLLTQLVLKTIDDLLNIAEDDFIALVQEILHNNAELYRRLA